MAENSDPKPPVETDNTILDSTPETPRVPVLSGVPKNFLDEKVHVGIAVEVKASGEKSVVMIPDVTGIGSGASPVYITKPIRIEGRKLRTFLGNKGVTPPEQVSNLLSDTTIALEAFYFCKDKMKMENGQVAKDKDGKDIVEKAGPILMAFELKFEKGIIESLVGEGIGDLFDVNYIALRVLRCHVDDYPALQQYAQELYAE